MRHPLFAAGALAAGLVAAFDASAQTIFIGTAQITKTSPNCDWTVGNRWSARYHPAGVGSNENASGLSLISDYNNALNIRTSEGDFSTSTLAPATMTGIFSFGGSYPVSAKVTRNPAKLTATTNAVTLTATVKNFDDVPDCTVVLTVLLQRRLD